MTLSIGLDIGGTKIAAAIFDQDEMRAQETVPTPTTYEQFLSVCGSLVEKLEKSAGKKAGVGIGIAGAINPAKGTVFASNIPCLTGKLFKSDMENFLRRPVQLANDANCAAFSEANGGAGEGYHSVFGLIMGTGVGGGFVIDGKIHHGAHGVAAEIGHVPLPFREDADGPLVPCGCGQSGCIDKSISGPSLARLYKHITGREMADSRHVVTSLSDGDGDAARVLDRFYTVVAKALTSVVHTFDPDIIVVAGGLNDLPGLYEEVPKRIGRYTLVKNIEIKFVPAKFGGTTGLRGAALLAR